MVPGAFTSGTNHFANARKPEDTKRVAAYDAGPYKGFAESTNKALAATVPPDADVSEVARAIARVSARSGSMSTRHRTVARSSV